MKITYLRWIDKYLGSLLCVVLSALTGSRRKKARPRTEKIDRILIIKLWGFGSIVLAYDFFQSIRKKFPDASLCAFTFKQNSPAFKMTGIFDEIYEVDIADLGRFAFPLFFKSIDVVRRLRKKSFDVSFDLEFTSRLSAAASFLINAKQRVGFRYRGVYRGNCYNREVPFRENKKLRNSFLSLLDVFDVKDPVPPGTLALKIWPREQFFIENLLKKKSLIDAKPIVAVNINASSLCLLRRWPKEYFVALATGLIADYSAHIIFIGSREDTRYVSSAIALFSPEQKKYAHNFSGKLSLEQLACLLKKMSLFISNDSGPLHLAAYLGIPTVSFFGPETPLIYGPEGEFHIVFYRGLSCSPCIRVKNYKFAQCTHGQRCLRKITPRQVLDEIKRKGIL